MSKLEKELARLESEPKDYTYNELKSLLNKLGFYENNKGKTSGSGIEFKDKYGRKILFHKPHPTTIIKPYIIKAILNSLREWRIV